MEAHTPQGLQDALSARRTTRAMSRISSRAYAPNADEFGLTKRKFARELDDAAADGDATAEALAPPARKPNKLAKPPPPAAVLAAARSRSFFLSLLSLESRLPWGVMKERYKYNQKRWIARVERAADEATFIAAEAGQALLDLESNLKTNAPRAGWAACRFAWQADVSNAVELASACSAHPSAQLDESLQRMESALRALRYALEPALDAVAGDVGAGSAMEVEAEEAASAGDDGQAVATDELCFLALAQRTSRAAAEAAVAEHQPLPAGMAAVGMQAQARSPSGSCAGEGRAEESSAVQTHQMQPSLEASPASTEPATRSPDGGEYRECRAAAPLRRPFRLQGWPARRQAELGEEAMWAEGAQQLQLLFQFDRRIDLGVHAVERADEEPAGLPPGRPPRAPAALVYSMGNGMRGYLSLSPPKPLGERNCWSQPAKEQAPAETGLHGGNEAGAGMLLCSESLTPAVCAHATEQFCTSYVLCYPAVSPHHAIPRVACHRRLHLCDAAVRRLAVIRTRAAASRWTSIRMATVRATLVSFGGDGRRSILRPGRILLLMPSYDYIVPHHFLELCAPSDHHLLRSPGWVAHQHAVLYYVIGQA